MRVTYIWKSNTTFADQRTRYKRARVNEATNFFMFVHDVLKQKCGENLPHCFSMARTCGMCVAPPDINKCIHDFPPVLSCHSPSETDFKYSMEPKTSSLFHHFVFQLSHTIDPNPWKKIISTQCDQAWKIVLFAVWRNMRRIATKFQNIWIDFHTLEIISKTISNIVSQVVSVVIERKQNVFPFCHQILNYRISRKVRTAATVSVAFDNFESVTKPQKYNQYFVCCSSGACW